MAASQGHAGTIPLLDKQTTQTDRFCQICDLSGTSSTDEEVSSRSGSPRKCTPLEPGYCCCWSDMSADEFIKNDMKKAAVGKNNKAAVEKSGL